MNALSAACARANAQSVATALKDENPFRISLIDEFENNSTNNNDNMSGENDSNRRLLSLAERLWNDSISVLTFVEQSPWLAVTSNSSMGFSKQPPCTQHLSTIVEHCRHAVTCLCAVYRQLRKRMGTNDKTSDFQKVRSLLEQCAQTAKDLNAVTNSLIVYMDSKELVVDSTLRTSTLTMLPGSTALAEQPTVTDCKHAMRIADTIDGRCTQCADEERGRQMFCGTPQRMRTQAQQPQQHQQQTGRTTTAANDDNFLFGGNNASLAREESWMRSQTMHRGGMEVSLSQMRTDDRQPDGAVVVGGGAADYSPPRASALPPARGIFAAEEAGAAHDSVTAAAAAIAGDVDGVSPINNVNKNNTTNIQNSSIGDAFEPAGRGSNNNTASATDAATRRLRMSANSVDPARGNNPPPQRNPQQNQQQQSNTNNGISPSRLRDDVVAQARSPHQVVRNIPPAAAEQQQQQKQQAAARALSRPNANEDEVAAAAAAAAAQQQPRARERARANSVEDRAAAAAERQQQRARARPRANSIEDDIEMMRPVGALATPEDAHQTTFHSDGTFSSPPSHRLRVLTEEENRRLAAQEARANREYENNNRRLNPPGFGAPEEIPDIFARPRYGTPAWHDHHLRTIKAARRYQLRPYSGLLFSLVLFVVGCYWFRPPHGYSNQATAAITVISLTFFFSLLIWPDLLFFDREKPMRRDAAGSVIVDVDAYEYNWQQRVLRAQQQRLARQMRAEREAQREADEAAWEAGRKQREQFLQAKAAYDEAVAQQKDGVIVANNQLPPEPKPMPSQFFQRNGAIRTLYQPLVDPHLAYTMQQQNLAMMQHTGLGHPQYFGAAPDFNNAYYGAPNNNVMNNSGHQQQIQPHPPAATGQQQQQNNNQQQVRPYQRTTTTTTAAAQQQRGTTGIPPRAPVTAGTRVNNPPMTF